MEYICDYCLGAFDYDLYYEGENICDGCLEDLKDDFRDE